MGRQNSNLREIGSRAGPLADWNVGAGPSSRPSMSVPKMDLSQYTLQVMARSIYGTHPCLSDRRPCLNSGLHFLSSRNGKSSHEQTIIEISPTMDGSCPP